MYKNGKFYSKEGALRTFVNFNALLTVPDVVGLLASPDGFETVLYKV